MWLACFVWPARIGPVSLGRSLICRNHAQPARAMQFTKHNSCSDPRMDGLARMKRADPRARPLDRQIYGGLFVRRLKRQRNKARVAATPHQQQKRFAARFGGFGDPGVEVFDRCHGLLTGLGDDVPLQKPFGCGL